ncbi:Abi family protein [Demequina pelophila]|uniref:Abi family protein n=1 Tax=Demequina pelophila TaxID=1638984 RepID=UPI00078106FC|nr:Abi family protein [Demequina pelophila]
MRYAKPALAFPEQAAQLMGRGLIADRAALIRRLETVSYFRLSGYAFAFRTAGSDRFRTGTRLEHVWLRYTFDRALRLLVLDALERVEVDVRTQLVTELAIGSGPFGYLDPAHLPGLSAHQHGRLLDRARTELQKSREDHAMHFKKKYAEHAHPPIWLMAELSSFGTLRELFTGASSDVRVTVADRYQVAPHVLDSWLRALTLVRNICAHHGRLWNKHLGHSPVIPRRSSKRPMSASWHHPIPTPEARIFPVMCALAHLMMVIAPESTWRTRVDDLVTRHAEIHPSEMGFPVGWRHHGLWNRYT